MGAFRLSLKYGASAGAVAAKTHANKLDKVQNIGLRTVLGATKTAPRAEMEKNAEPLGNRSQPKLLIHLEKMKRMPVHLTIEQQKEHADIRTTDVHICEKQPKPLATRNPTSRD